MVQHVSWMGHTENAYIFIEESEGKRPLGGLNLQKYDVGNVNCIHVAHVYRIGVVQ